MHLEAWEYDKLKAKGDRCEHRCFNIYLRLIDLAMILKNHNNGDDAHLSQAKNILKHLISVINNPEEPI